MLGWDISAVDGSTSDVRDSWSRDASGTDKQGQERQGGEGDLASYKEFTGRRPENGEESYIGCLVRGRVKPGRMEEGSR